MSDYRVMIRRCENYDRNTILDIVRAGMRELNYHPAGNIYVKPNVVFASKKGKYGSTAYTHPTLMGASLLALSESKDAVRIDLGEKTAIGYPTRMNFKYAGYYKEIKSIRKKAATPVGIFCIDEVRRDNVFVGGQVHAKLRVARKMARADTMVYLPKLKCHCVSTMTGAVKLNIGICSDDERAIRHDFLLDHKIVDLLAVGSPDFIVMDAIDVGIGNEAVPTPRKLGLIIMGTNPLAVDLVGARLLGYDLDDVPYLKQAVERGYLPAGLDQVVISGDLNRIDDLDRAAQRIMPYDDAYQRWQDIHKELARMKSPIRFFWGYSKAADKSKCGTGCVMGAKMFFGFMERYAGEKAFKKAKPVVLVIGKIEDPIDAKGQQVFMIGSCSQANVMNAKKIIRIDNCFTTAVDLAIIVRGRLGIPAPISDPKEILPLVYHFFVAILMKIKNLRYFQDMGYSLKNILPKKI